MPLAESVLAVRRQAELGSLTLENTGNCSVRHVVLDGLEGTIWPDSGARVGATHFHIFLLLGLVNTHKGVGTVVFASQGRLGLHWDTAVLTPGGPEIR